MRMIMDFVVGILQYVVKAVIMIGAAVLGVFAGKALRSKKDKSKARIEQ